MQQPAPEPAAELLRLRRRLQRERASRQQAEFLSEHGLRELYERKQQLELLEKIATAANQAANAEDALRLAVVEICRFSGWEVGHVYNVEAGETRPRLVSTGIWYADDLAAIEPFRRASERGDFRGGIGLPGRTLLARKAAWITDLMDDDNFPRAYAARYCGLRAASAYPVLSGDEVVGVLEFFARAAREPDEALLHVTSQICLQLGRAIERQRINEILRRRAEDLAEAHDAAQSANRAKSQFLANMSHELRTPLNAIIGFAEIMKDETFGSHNIPVYRDYCGHIFEAGNQLLAIINDILDLSKIEAGRAELGPEEAIDLPALIADTCATLSLQAERSRIALRIECPAGLPRLIGSRRVIRQILTNLLSNALKFTSEGGTISTSVALTPAGELALRVSDTGIGMTEAEIAIALTPFGQIEGSLSRRHKGTGLGLPLTLAMARLHQAEFNVTSSRGVGTTIELIFPASRSSGGEPARACA